MNRKIAIVVASLFLAGVVPFLLRGSHSNAGAQTTALDAAYQRLAREGISLDLASYAPDALPAADENAAVRYKAILNQIYAGDYGRLLDLDQKALKEFLRAEGWKGDPGFLTQVRDITSQVIDAGKRAHCEFDLDWEKGGEMILPGVPLPVLDAMAISYHAAESLDEKISIFGGALKLVYAFEFGEQVGVDLASGAGMYLLDLMPLPGFERLTGSEDQLDALASAISVRSDGLALVRDASRFEIGVSIRQLESDRSTLAEDDGNVADLVDRNIEALIEQRLAFFAELKAPTHTLIERLERAAEKHDQRVMNGEVFELEPGPLGFICSPDIKRHVVSWLEWQARQETLKVTIRAIQYRLRSGSWPTSVAELHKEDGKGLTRDVFSGKPLLIRVDESRLKVYSVGRNGRDDDGLMEDHQRYDIGTIYRGVGE